MDCHLWVGGAFASDGVQVSVHHVPEQEIDRGLVLSMMAFVSLGLVVVHRAELNGKALGLLVHLRSSPHLWS